MQKRIALFFVVILLVLAVIPAYYPVDDETARQDCPFCTVYGLLFTATSVSYGIYHDFRPIERSVTPGISYNQPKALPSAKESRAPPA